MAGRAENLKGLLSNSRTRMIIIFTAVVLIGAVIFALIKMNDHGAFDGLRSKTKGGAALGTIQSIPGSLSQTTQYAALQQKQNEEQAVQAGKSGGSAIPTIIRSQIFGQGVESVGAQGGEGGVGFQTLARSEESGTPKDEWLKTLRDDDCSKEGVDSVLTQGAQITDLVPSCSCLQLKRYGYALADLRKVCECKELKALSYTAVEMKNVGFTADQLRVCGYIACQVVSAGYNAEDMKNAGYSDGELKGAGFSEQDILAAGGLPSGMSIDDVRKAGCDVAALKKLREAGVSAAAIRRINGCSAAALRAAGYSAKELKDAGFSAAELKAAGFSPEELNRAGFDARDLLNAGFSPAELAAGGFSEDAIRKAEALLPPEMTSNMLKRAGCDPATLKRERLAGVSAEAIKRSAGCDAKALLAAGFSSSDLARAGFSAAELAGVSDEAIRAAGCDPEKLKKLREQGVSADKIHRLNGCSAAILKAAGFDAQSLRDAGFTPEQLLSAGFTAKELEGGINDDLIKAAGCDPVKLKALRDQGVTAQQIRKVSGCSAADLKAAGFGARELADAGFSPSSLLSAGFDRRALEQAGLVPTDVLAVGRTADCSVESLKAARALHVSAKTIKDTLGCSAAAMRAAGYLAQELKDAGFTAGELKNAGFSAKELKDAGFGAKDLKDAGFSEEALKAAGFSAQALKEAGLMAAQDIAEEVSTRTPTKSNVTTAPASAIKQPSVSFSRNPTIGTRAPSPAQTAEQRAESAKQLASIMHKQQNYALAQRDTQKIQQRMSAKLSFANQLLQRWKVVNPQAYIGGSGDKKDAKGGQGADGGPGIVGGAEMSANAPNSAQNDSDKGGQVVIKTGDILFGVIDTGVNTDEPSPVLASIVSGKLKGAKLIGSFNQPANADTMIITFNTLSVPGVDKTLSVNAYAIDPDTARTAISSETDHHYLMRYGSLFASSFLEGFGQAMQSSDTTVSIGGTGGTSTTTVQSGVGRTTLDNAIIGLSAVGQAWGTQAKKNVNRPTTVQVFSGTGIGILFMQDVVINIQ